MACSSIVIKAKFGETLRRFSATINDRKLALDIIMLREKICSLFSFDSGVEFTLTYVDEDGDAVTLADDDDLDDIMRQSLNPLRITLNINSSNHGRSTGTYVAAPLNQTVNGASNVNSESSTVNGCKVPAIHEAGSSNLKKKKKQVQKYASIGALINAIGKNKSATDGDVSGGSLNEPLLKPADFATLAIDSTMKHSQDRITTQIDTKLKKGNNDSGSFSSWVQGKLNPTNQCPSESDSLGHYLRYSCGPRLKRDNFDNNGIENICHKGVGCDGCGVNPINGPRFKSTVKYDYDLCGDCFAIMGNVANYIRIDRPTDVFNHPMPSMGFHDPFHSFRIPIPTPPHALRALESNLPWFKLDSRFILDVNVVDGTIMAPFTTFTKIWRIRNNGSIIWPHGSQLQWIGGDRLSTSQSVEVQIPTDGLPVGKEVDIAVDFTAPERPGRYVSYWRMASTCGLEFGQRVWVLIQVDASTKNLGITSFDLNLPPVEWKPELVNQVPLTYNNLSGNNFIKVPESVDSPLINNFGVVGPTFSSGSYPTVGLNSTFLEPDSDPTVDVSVMPPTMVDAAPSPTAAVVQPSVSATLEVSDDQEQALVKDLEEMGFGQLDLNKEILRMNNFDLEKSIDDLCGVSEWDPMLDELQEMGFEDNEGNKRLLKKNNGRMKRVVMDLINGDKA